MRITETVVKQGGSKMNGVGQNKKKNRIELINKVIIVGIYMKLLIKMLFYKSISESL